MHAGASLKRKGQAPDPKLARQVAQVLNIKHGFQTTWSVLCLMRLLVLTNSGVANPPSSDSPFHGRVSDAVMGAFEAERDPELGFRTRPLQSAIREIAIRGMFVFADQH
jgi:hypothetical protein